MTHLEYVARALFKARFGGNTAPSGLTFDDLVTETRANYMAMAKAAVEAIYDIDRQLVLSRAAFEEGVEPEPSKQANAVRYEYPPTRFELGNDHVPITLKDGR